MNLQAPNPYQAPTTDPSDAIRGAMEETLGTRSRVEFETEITRRDLRTAIRGKNFRRDLHRLRRAAWLIAIPTALVVLLITIRIARSGGLGGLPLLLVGVVVVLILYAVAMYWWLVQKHVKANSESLGPIRGWMDRNWLWIQDQDQTRVRPIRYLVGAARNRDQIVLCFDTTHTLFETLPMRGFEDPDTAQILADQLEQARPFENMLPLDSRRLQEPSDDPLFEPGQDAHFFAGRLLLDDIRGTPLARAQRLARWTVLGQTLISVGILSLLILTISFDDILSITAISIIGLFFVRAAVRILRSPLVGQADRGVMFYTSGWIDDENVFTMSAIGQTLTHWSAFDEAVITDRVISLRTKSGLLWYLIGRGQFPDQVSWDSACRFVRERMK